MLDAVDPWIARVLGAIQRRQAVIVGIRLPSDRLASRSARRAPLTTVISTVLALVAGPDVKEPTVSDRLIKFNPLSKGVGDFGAESRARSFALEHQNG
jgi:hypothetical protein